MTTIKHLQKIKAECERLLALSEKRTQGKWNNYYHRAEIRDRFGQKIAKCDQTDRDRNNMCYPFSDGDYIAACAGAAEAGWRSTIAAIDCIEDMAEHIGNHQASLIIAAWPTELLQ